MECTPFQDMDMVTAAIRCGLAGVAARFNVSQRSRGQRMKCAQRVLYEGQEFLCRQSPSNIRDHRDGGAIEMKRSSRLLVANYRCGCLEGQITASGFEICKFHRLSPVGVHPEHQNIMNILWEKYSQTRPMEE